MRKQLLLSVFVISISASAFGATDGFSEAVPEKQIQRESSAYLVPAIHIQTSPIGDVFKRYNLQVGHFFSEHFALSAKGAIFNNASQTLFGYDDGHEAGLRASYYLIPGSGKTLIGGHLGAYYANFKRGDALGEGLGSLFQDPTIDRDEVNGVAFEFVAGPLLRWNQRFTTEFLVGMQTYRASYYTYNRSTGARLERLPSAWKAFAVLELNVGMTF